MIGWTTFGLQLEIRVFSFFAPSFSKTLARLCVNGPELYIPIATGRDWVASHTTLVQLDWRTLCQSTYEHLALSCPDNKLTKHLPPIKEFFLCLYALICSLFYFLKYFSINLIFRNSNIIFIPFIDLMTAASVL